MFPEFRGIHWSELLLAHHYVLSCERHRMDDHFCRYTTIFDDKKSAEFGMLELSHVSVMHYNFGLTEVRQFENCIRHLRSRRLLTLQVETDNVDSHP